MSHACKNICNFTAFISTFLPDFSPVNAFPLSSPLPLLFLSFFFLLTCCCSSTHSQCTNWRLCWMYGHTILITDYLFQPFFKKKCQTFDSSFLNVRICYFSLWFMTWSLFCMLGGQKKKFEDVTYFWHLRDYRLQNWLILGCRGWTQS